jgi:hypothetical protein
MVIQNNNGIKRDCDASAVTLLLVVFRVITIKALLKSHNKECEAISFKIYLPLLFILLFYYIFFHSILYFSSYFLSLMSYEVV